MTYRRQCNGFGSGRDWQVVVARAVLLPSSLAQSAATPVKALCWGREHATSTARLGLASAWLGTTPANLYHKMLSQQPT